MCFDPSPRDPDSITVAVSRAGIRDAVLALRCDTLRAIAACKDVPDKMAERPEPEQAEVRR
jgi:hypothetical protein